MKLERLCYYLLELGLPIATVDALQECAPDPQTTARLQVSHIIRLLVGYLDRYKWKKQSNGEYTKRGKTCSFFDNTTELGVVSYPVVLRVWVAFTRFDVFCDSKNLHYRKSASFRTISYTDWLHFLRSAIRFAPRASARRIKQQT